ncbi:N-acetyltransferase family protein [Bacteroides sp.]
MIRKVKPMDSRAITGIYNEYIVNSTATFETEPISEKEMERRIFDIMSQYPYLVYEIDDTIVGYCYAHAWKERAAYNKTLETTVYVSMEYRGKSIGKQLMINLIEECKKQDYSALIACITAENEKSRAFHMNLGFKQVSLFEKVGIKFGRTLDVADYELLLKP